MLKKTLLAAAVAATFSSASFAAIISSNGVFVGAAAEEEFATTELASQTKQVVLNWSTYQQNVDVRFNNTNADPAQSELKDRGYIAFDFTGPVALNEQGVIDFLKSDDGVSAQGVSLLENTINAYFVYSGQAYQVFVDAGNADQEIYQRGGDWFLASGDGTTSADDTNPQNNTAKTATLELKDVLKYDDTAKRFDYQIEGSTLLLTLDDNVVANTIGNNVDIAFDFKEANQAFRLTSGATGSIDMTVGAISNAAYTADPQSINEIFKFVNLFTLGYTNPGEDAGKVDATALVGEGFVQWAEGKGNTVHTSAIPTKSVTIANNTTNQPLQKRHVRFAINGDFSGLAIDKDGYLLSGVGTRAPGEWLVNAERTSATRAMAPATDTTNLVGKGITETAPAASKQAIATSFFVAEANELPIEAGKYEFVATVVDNPSFNTFSQSIASIFNVSRDGLKFDTITTGSTSANTIHIRDVSRVLPAAGGKIYVTIVEYDAHGLDQNAEGNVLVERKELSLTLPSGGAVTLSPAGVAADVGAAINPARQARFVFEVETNIGEVAVKKQTSEGIDIQNGSQAEEKKVVDFTL